MKNEEEDARRAGDLGNLQRDEREDYGSSAAAEAHSTAAAEDEENLRLARDWRNGRRDAWAWLVGRLAEAQEAGRHFESFRRLTDELSQVHDFLDDSGRGKVTVPHRRGLGRGLALLMVQEHPEFGSLFRMRSGR